MTLRLTKLTAHDRQKMKRSPSRPAFVSIFIREHHADEVQGKRWSPPTHLPVDRAPLDPINADHGGPSGREGFRILQ